MLLDVGDRGMLSTRNFLPLSDNHQLLLCGEALKQAGNIQQCLMWLPSNMVLMSYGYTVSGDCVFGFNIRCCIPISAIVACRQIVLLFHKL